MGKDLRFFSNKLVRDEHFNDKQGRYFSTI